jgi:2,3-bisphosphoglycerate-dependent phosphoglycerate mutase
MNLKKHRIILVRHGESEANLARSKSYDRIGGRSESPLSVTGIAQAEDLRKTDIISSPEGSIIYSSPSQRAFATALIATGCREEDIIVDDRLSERSLGDVEGLSLESVKSNPMYSSYFEENNGFKFRHSFIHHLPGGESYSDVVDRTQSWFHDCYKKIPENVCTIKVFSHIITMRCIIHWMLKITEEDTLNLRIDNAVPIIIDYAQDGVGTLVSSPLVRF